MRECLLNFLHVYKCLYRLFKLVPLRYSLLLTISDYSQPYFSGNACFGFDDNQIADFRHSVESSLQSGEHEDLFVASVNLLTSAAHYQPAFLIAFFSTTESEDVAQSNDSGINHSANEASSGLLGSKKSRVINAILLYIERSDDLIKRYSLDEGLGWFWFCCRLIFL